MKTSFWPGVRWCGILRVWRPPARSRRMVLFSPSSSAASRPTVASRLRSTKPSARSARPIRRRGALDSLDAAIENLQAREGMTNPQASASSNRPPASKAISPCSHLEAVATIGAWVAAAGYDAAIWIAVKILFGDWGRAASRSPSPRRSGISKLWRGKCPGSSRRRSPIFAMRRPRSKLRCARTSAKCWPY